METRDKVYIKFKTLEWFSNNAFKDHDGDYHSTEKAKEFFDAYHQDVTHNSKHDKVVYWEYAGKFREVFSEDLDSYKWCLDEICTIEEYPELYI